MFGSVVFRAREHGEMPPPGDMRPARLTVVVRDLVWEALYAPVAAGVSKISERLNHLQFLTIRQYLSLVFGALVALPFALWVGPPWEEPAADALAVAICHAHHRATARRVEAAL